MLAVGLIFLILSFPTEDKIKTTVPGKQQTVQAASNTEGRYEEDLEKRVKKVLRNVEGVGEVDVMIVLKSTEEKIYRTDRSTASSSISEEDSGGGTRKTETKELEESTVLTGGSGSTGPVLEKELKPEIAGIVISAQGGGSPSIKAEISAAMEALFDVPQHKIKVLKRVD